LGSDSILQSARPSATLRPVSEGGRVIQGPWRRLGKPDAAAEPGEAKSPEVAAPPNLTDSKMMLGFIVRDCAVALGHQPSPNELAEWANHQQGKRGEYCLFGRAITVEEATVILRHPARPVTVREDRQRPKLSSPVSGPR
jgi:hypothetical protein